ncbi:MAG: PLP-dependent aminotransferase family protein [Gammaproteobacteria bacterium]|nr:PLP-dependent aminotransferase family protein [Gammaproteobacteria bacterium]MDE2262197.1 PLP-dependent aminotransferase family protein [Gammaproteobacteria bacterium]
MDRLHAGFMPPVALDPASETPLYRQISVWFQRAILAGHLQPGQRVPSTRALAKELGVSRIPVLSAYELLIAEGYFQPFVGAGTCVSQSIPDAAYRPGKDGLANAASVAPESNSRRAVSRRASGMAGAAQAWLGRCRGCTDLEHFPIGIWSKLVNRYARKISRDVMGYGEPMGYGPFRAAVADYLGAFRAVRCDPSQVLVTTGAQQGLLISALTLLDPGDEAWVEEPGYPATHQALRAAAARLVPVPVDREGMQVACAIQAAKHARAAFVTPSHQFPLSVTMSAARRIELLGWAARHGAWIVEDDYDSEYRFCGNPIASLQGLDSDGRVIYVGTLAKVMFPTLRLGFIVVPKDLMPSFLSIRSAHDTFSTSVLYQMAMTDFIREGHFARHIKRMRSVYMERRESLMALIDAELGDVLEVVGEDAGMQLMALLPPGIDDVNIVTEAHQAGLRVNAMSQCYVRPPERGGLMLDYAVTGAQAVASRLDVLKAILHPYRPRQRSISAA